MILFLDVVSPSPKFVLIDNDKIDKENILKCTLDGMHLCLDELSEKNDFTNILVDGNHFNPYYSKEKDDFVFHECVIKGDDKYKSIAAASILAKTYRDNYILKLEIINFLLLLLDIYNYNVFL